MPSAVLDTTVLVSAFLRETGVNAAVLTAAKDGAYRLCLAHVILEEAERVLLETSRIRRRYAYPDHSVMDFVVGLRVLADIVTDLPPLSGVVRDPNDDMIVACAVAASASYIVTSDNDLLSLEVYEDITIITPEAFMALLRDR